MSVCKLRIQLWGPVPPRASRCSAAHTNTTRMRVDIEHIELPAKLLDDFLQGNKSNINRSTPMLPPHSLSLTHTHIHIHTHPHTHTFTHIHTHFVPRFQTCSHSLFHPHTHTFTHTHTHFVSRSQTCSHSLFSTHLQTYTHTESLPHTLELTLDLGQYQGLILSPWCNC